MPIRDYKSEVQTHLRGMYEELKELKKGCICYDPKAIDWARDLEILTYTPKGHIYFREPDGSVFHATSSYLKQIEIIGHPITLNYYLRALPPSNGMSHYYGESGVSLEVRYDDVQIYFSLLTGEPATEDDYKKIAEVLQIKID